MAGTFNLPAPHAGTFCVRVEPHGWAPVHGPMIAGAANETKLPRVRFTPAIEAGKATCELIRMQVNFSPR
jgi:hypothetical protein